MNIIIGYFVVGVILGFILGLIVSPYLSRMDKEQGEAKQGLKIIPFQCPKCKKIKEWHEAPICESCGWDETKEIMK